MYTDAGEANDGSQPNDRGWSVYLTVYSRERNIDSDNNPRTNLNDTDVNTLSDTMTSAFGPELADFILAYRLYGAVHAAGRRRGGWRRRRRQCGRRQ